MKAALAKCFFGTNYSIICSLQEHLGILPDTFFLHLRFSPLSSFPLSPFHSASCPSFLFPPYLFSSFPHFHLTSVQYFHFSSFQHSSFLHFYLVFIFFPPIPALHLSSFPLFLYFSSPISSLSPLLLFPALLSTFSFLFYFFPLFHLPPFLLSSFPLFATHFPLLSILLWPPLYFIAKGIWMSFMLSTHKKDGFIIP